MNARDASLGGHLDQGCPEYANIGRSCDDPSSISPRYRTSPFRPPSAIATVYAHAGYARRPGRCPTGKTLRLIGSSIALCQAPPRKIFRFIFSENRDYLRSSRLHLEGRIAIVTDVGSGERWTSWCRRRAASRRTVKSCGPDSPMLGSSLARTFGGATGANKPAPRGEHEAAVKTIAQGVPVVSAALWFLACAMCTLLCTQGSRVRPASGIPCALLSRRANAPGIPRAFVPRECGRVPARESDRAHAFLNRP